LLPFASFYFLFIYFYFHESGLFNGLSAIEIKKIAPHFDLALKLRSPDIVKQPRSPRPAAGQARIDSANANTDTAHF